MTSARGDGVLRRHLEVLARTREIFGRRFTDSRAEAEHAATVLLNQPAGDLDREEATQLSRLFNAHAGCSTPTR